MKAYKRSVSIYYTSGAFVIIVGVLSFLSLKGSSSSVFELLVLGLACVVVVAVGLILLTIPLVPLIQIDKFKKVTIKMHGAGWTTYTFKPKEIVKYQIYDDFFEHKPILHLEYKDTHGTRQLNLWLKEFKNQEFYEFSNFIEKSVRSNSI